MNPPAFAMKTASATRIWTDDELMALDSKDGRKHELWHGRIVTMSPAGAAHGARLAGMLDLKHKSVRIYRKAGKFELLGEGRNLTGNAVLPGFRLAITRLFEDPAFS